MAFDTSIDVIGLSLHEEEGQQMFILYFFWSITTFLSTFNRVNAL